VHDLTDRQRRLIEAFLTPGPPGSAYLCATRAAAAVGYAWPGKQGPRLRAMPRGAAAVEAEFYEEFPECPIGRHGRPRSPGPVHVGKS
jgi:hypothetical protein